MCGIAGMLRFDGRPVEASDLDDMLRRLSHRGRDHCAAVAGSGGPLSRTADVVLGHRRLSIIDLSEAGAQPMASPDGRIWVTFNGEIYNYIEVREDLKARGHCFRTQSDTEVLIAAYREWGDACVSRLNGMFAFALWDEERRRLFCARDHLGIKPFYYAATTTCLAFASESKALQQFHRNAIDADGLAAYLLGLYVPASWSIFSGVAKLLPGHVMTVEPSGRITTARYWSVTKAGDVGDTPEERQALEEKLKQAISRQLRSDVPVGALLSGGVDSGMVVALAAAQGARLHTYSVGFEGLAVDELPAAAAVAAASGSYHHPTVVTAAESVELLDVSLAHLSEPIADPAVVPSYRLSQMAAADGVKVLLSGTGGDEIFGGYERYVGASLRRRALTVLPEWARVATGQLLPAHSKLGTRLRNIYFDMLFTAGGDFDLCAGALGDEAALSGFFSRLAAALPIHPCATGWPLTYKQMGFDMSAYLPDEILLLFDQMSMAHTIEGRVPLIDVEVVEAALRFPASSHVSANRTKVLFREMAIPYLGQEHVWRKKQGFAGPVPWWVRNHWGHFRDVAMSTLSIPGMAGAGAVVRRLCEASEPAGDPESHAVFILYCLRRWYDSLG